MTQRGHVGIAGAGLVGRILAFSLLRRGWRVTLFDRDRLDGRESCGMAGAGMLAPFAELEHAEPIVNHLGLEGLHLWPQILSACKKPVFFQQEGSLMVAEPKDRPDLARIHRRVLAKVEDAQDVIPVDSHAMRHLEPNLCGRFGAGLFFPSEGQLEGWELFPALMHEILDRGARWHACTEIRHLGAHRIETQDGAHEFDWVMDCRGLGARPDLKRLRGVRGELIAVEAPNVRLTRPIRLIQPRFPVYVVPRPDSIYLIGATVIESDSLAPLSVRGGLELLAAAYHLDPGFATARICNVSIHCRPAFPDNVPRVVHRPGLIRLNGLYRHGFLATPAIVADVLAHLAGALDDIQFPELWHRESE